MRLHCPLKSGLAVTISQSLNLEQSKCPPPPHPCCPPDWTSPACIPESHLRTEKSGSCKICEQEIIKVLQISISCNISFTPLMETFSKYYLKFFSSPLIQPLKCGVLFGLLTYMQHTKIQESLIYLLRTASNAEEASYQACW